MVRKKSGIPGLSFSWRRASGLSAAKGQLSRKIGTPLTRSGRQRKVGRGAGCAIPFFIGISILATICERVIAGGVDQWNRVALHGGDKARVPYQTFGCPTLDNFSAAADLGTKTAEAQMKATSPAEIGRLSDYMEKESKRLCPLIPAGSEGTITATAFREHELVCLRLRRSSGCVWVDPSFIEPCPECTD
jgi:hypothetical protein